MLDALLPRAIDNTYRGHRAALWLFGLVVSVRMLQSLVVIFNGHSTAINADGHTYLLRAAATRSCGAAAKPPAPSPTYA